MMAIVATDFRGWANDTLVQFAGEAQCEIERLRELADSEGTRAVDYLRRARAAEAERDALRVDSIRLHSLLHDCDVIARVRGNAYLFDAIDNDAVAYQSQALADALAKSASKNSKG